MDIANRIGIVCRYEEDLAYALVSVASTSFVRRVPAVVSKRLRCILLCNTNSEAHCMDYIC